MTREFYFYFWTSVAMFLTGFLTACATAEHWSSVCQ